MPIDIAESQASLATLSPRGTVEAPARSRRSFVFRTDTVRATLSMIDQAIFSGTSFVTAVMVGRATSPDVLGLYYLTLTIAYVTIGIQECTIAIPYAIISAKRDGQDLREYTASTWIHYLCWSALCVTGLVTAIVLTSWRGESDVTPGLKILAVALPFLLLRESLRRFSFARFRLITAVLLDGTCSAVQLGGLVALWYTDRMTLLGIFGVMAGGCAVASLGWIVTHWRTPALVAQRVLSDWRETWSISSWSLASFMLTNTIPFIMPWIVEFAAGTAAAGLYGASATLIGMTNVLILGGSNFLIPRAADAFATRGSIGLSRVLSAMAIVFIIVIGAFGIGLLLTGDLVPRFVYGPEFQGTGPLVATLAANQLVASLGMIAAQGLLVIGRQSNNFVIDICMFSITMVAAAFLVPRHGALGAAVAALMGVSAGTLLRALRLNYVLRGMRRVPATT